MKIFNNYKAYDKKFIVFAHRGVPELCQENTLESFKKAIELGYDGIELDVMLSKDNKLIVHHDLSIQYNLRKKAICDLKYQEILENLSYNPPKLEEVLECIGHQTIINIEIKNQNNNFKMVEKINNCLKFFNLIDNIIISSFNSQTIKYSKIIDDRFATAWIWGNSNFHFFNHWNIILKHLRPNAIHIKNTLINQKIVEKIQAQNIKVLAYTINNDHILRKIISKKIDGIFTDSPSILELTKSLNL